MRLVGFAGLEILRRLIGAAHVKDIENILDIPQKLSAQKTQHFNSDSHARQTTPIAFTDIVTAILAKCFNPYGYMQYRTLENIMKDYYEILGVESRRYSRRNQKSLSQTSRSGTIQTKIPATKRQKKNSKRHRTLIQCSLTPKSDASMIYADTLAFTGMGFEGYQNMNDIFTHT